MNKISSKKIKYFFKKKLKDIALPKDVIQTTLESLIEASLFGIDSHGVNLFSHYYDCLINGRIKKGKNLVFKTKKSFVKCDARNNLANYAARKLLMKLEKKSNKYGISFGSIINSDHIGAVGIHGINSGIKNKIIIGFTNADALAVVPDGKNIIFGTNPISLVMNIDNEITYIDLATTKFSMNKVKNFRRENSNLPDSIARDLNLNPTNDPFKATFLEPIGGHKGFALAYLVEILTSGLSNQENSLNLLPMYGTDLKKSRGVSHTFLVINPEFIGIDCLKSLKFTVRNTIQNVSDKQADLIPGRKELLTKKKRISEGIPVSNEILKGWVDLGFDND
tara:strand:- start:3847 stop:4854 length:1008 start_codon:yes stop_codon:yes gene_type:complete